MLLLNPVVKCGAVAYKIAYDGYTQVLIAPFTLIQKEISVRGKTYWAALDAHN